MKKVSLILAALALVLGISQCKKQEEPAASGEKQHIVLNASFGDSNAKIAEDGIGGLKWTDEDGHKDIIKVYNSSETEIGTLECTDAAKGTFEGDITETTGDITFTFGELKYTEQTGELNDAISLTAEAPYDKNGNYDVTMNMPHAVLKLDVSALGTSGKLEIKVGETLVASVTDVSAPKAVFVAIQTDGNEKEYKISIGDKTATKTWTLLSNTFYTKSNGAGGGTGDAIVIPITPKFTVAAGTTVEFSKGNLWYGSADDAKPVEKAFHFEKNQWGFVSSWDETHVIYFKWSNATNAVTSDESYSGDLFCTSNFTVDGKEGWRTMSKDEWNYLLSINPDANKQQEGYGRENALSLSKWSAVTFGESGPTASGLIIMPDGWTGTLSATTDYTTWQSLESSGAVFLPAVGYRKIGTTNVLYSGYGYYWSGTRSGDTFAYGLTSRSDKVFTASANRKTGYLVRLVRDVK